MSSKDVRLMGQKYNKLLNEPIINNTSDIDIY